MKKFGSVNDGLQAMKQLVDSQRRKVGALLTFQNQAKKMVDACFLFESVENLDSQLINRYPDPLKISGESRADMPHLLGARQAAIGSVLAVMEPDDLGLEQPGHAEEFLIRNFGAACSQVDDIAYVTIYLSHSPCTTHDAAPSNSLPGQPRSCTAKFQLLAATYPQYHFSVCYWREFGYLEGKGSPETLLKALSGNRGNLAFAKL